MSYRAHKDPCGVVGCPQFICMDASKELRASNAALKADNEALKKELPSEAFKAGCQKNMDDAKTMNQELFRKNSSLSAEIQRLREADTWRYEKSDGGVEIHNLASFADACRSKDFLIADQAAAIERAREAFLAIRQGHESNEVDYMRDERIIEKALAALPAPHPSPVRGSSSTEKGREE